MYKRQQLPPPPGGVGGGIGNAILGSFIVTIIAALIAIPIGVGGGIYLAEYSTGRGFSQFIRFGTNVLAGVPSIIAGVFVYGTIVSTRIYDEPPTPATYPFIRFGNITPQADDTDGDISAEVSMNVEAFSQTTGRVECAQIAEAVRLALHRQESAVSLTGFNLIELRCDSYSVNKIADDRGHKASVLFTAMMQQT